MTHCFSFYEGKPLERIQKEYTCIIYADLHRATRKYFVNSKDAVVRNEKKITFILPSVVPNENVMYT